MGFRSVAHNACLVDAAKVPAVKMECTADPTNVGLGVLDVKTGNIYLEPGSALSKNPGHADVVKMHQLSTPSDLRGFTVVQDQTGKVTVQNFSGLNRNTPGAINNGFGMDPAVFAEVEQAMKAAGF
jgi:hypothetical protein